MEVYVAKVLVIVTSVFVGLMLLVSYALYRKRKCLEKRSTPAASDRKYIPPYGELRKRDIPVIDSVPFWVPGRRGKIVNVEVQPRVKRLGPRSSTPKDPRKQRLEKSTLLVDLLDSKHLDKANLVMSPPTSTFTGTHWDATPQSHSSVFSPVSLSPRSTQDTRTQTPPQASGRRRPSSFEIEMTYDELQLSSLQFSVMGYDEYSRQKVLGDVVLPMAELSMQGLDVTRELIMWRDVQTREMQRSKEKKSSKEIGESSAEPTASESQCSPS
ncbi:predicted protein [Nematostella vectensis]|uniref:Uncharacterized protein n=1 Tax=Nematostella vectensis TaxID=45351 RepID=A7RUV0_NEMVE|nr:predicted protein [Nematostella vectensis]|eukprot:XP_001636818.1 predicted protein [Nematostella vectensis]